jgi:hypothetical protein
MFLHEAAYETETLHVWTVWQANAEFPWSVLNNGTWTHHTRVVVHLSFVDPPHIWQRGMLRTSGFRLTALRNLKPGSYPDNNMPENSGTTWAWNNPGTAALPHMATRAAAVRCTVDGSSSSTDFSRLTSNLEHYTLRRYSSGVNTSASNLADTKGQFDRQVMQFGATATWKTQEPQQQVRSSSGPLLPRSLPTLQSDLLWNLLHSERGEVGNGETPGARARSAPDAGAAASRRGGWARLALGPPPQPSPDSGLYTLTLCPGRLVPPR